MRIGIDARFYSIAGPGRYTKNLIKSLEEIDRQNEYIIFLRSENFAKYHPKNPKFQKVLADYNWYSFKEQISMLFSIARFRVDLMHFPHFNVPLFYRRQFVLTIHDLIMHEFSTERATTRSRVYYRFKRIIYRLLFLWAVKRAKKILVPSNSTKTELIQRLGVKGEKVIVTYEGVDEKFEVQVCLPARPAGGPARQGSRFEVDRSILKKYGIRKPYLFYLGSMYPHKNVEGLIEAFKILKEQYGFEGQLVLVGKKDYFSERVMRETANLEVAKDIIFPGLWQEGGYLLDDEVVSIFKQAEVFVFPSLKEGFGLPLLEAMALKSPIAAGDIPAVREVCQEACLYFDPKNSKDIAEKVARILSHERVRNGLVIEGEKQVKKFSWQRMAQQTLSVYGSLDS